MNVPSFRQLVIPAEANPQLTTLGARVFSAFVKHGVEPVGPPVFPVTWRFVGPSLTPTPIPLASGLPDGMRRPVFSVVLPATTTDDQLAIVKAELAGGPADQTVELQADPPVRASLWANGAPFGTRRQARDLIEADGLAAAAQAGREVRVVIVDQGFDRNLFPNNYAGGFSPQINGVPPDEAQSGIWTQPGQGRSEHAAATVRAVLNLAPGARIYDAPLIPLAGPGARATISDITAFVADTWYLWCELWLTVRSTWEQKLPISWVLVNAWSLYDRAADRGTQYSTSRAHVLNWFVDVLVKHYRVDTVFAAGNCGQFAPDIRCGVTDRGPCRSILGANSLDSVLTVGAVQTDGTWLGYSSQGPGQELLGTDKPDLCAPSGFTEPYGSSTVAAGTSMSAAVAGGVVAALRGQFGQDTVTPAKMKDVLRMTARKVGEPVERMGQGILRGGSAARALS